MATELQKKVKVYILENYLFTSDESALGLDESLLDRGIVDSTGMLEIIMYIEEQFGIAVADDEMLPDNLDSVSRIAGFIARKQ